jgi:hypothetical protein
MLRRWVPIAVKSNVFAGPFKEATIASLSLSLYIIQRAVASHRGTGLQSKSSHGIGIEAKRIRAYQSPKCPAIRRA